MAEAGRRPRLAVSDGRPVMRHARIELPSSDYERLQRAAKREFLPITAYIRQAVMKRIESDEVRGMAAAHSSRTHSGVGNTREKSN